MSTVGWSLFCDFIYSSFLPSNCVYYVKNIWPNLSTVKQQNFEVQMTPMRFTKI